MSDTLLDEGIHRHLIPYLIMDEHVADDEYQLLFSEIITERQLIYFYFARYDGRFDAIKLFAENMETKDTEGWVILIDERDKTKADTVLIENPSQFKYFEPLEQRFFKLLTVGELVKVLLSEQLRGPSLRIVQGFLEQKGIVYTEEDIQKMRLNTQGEKLKAEVFPTEFVTVIFIVAILIFIWLFFDK